ncbi:alpha/beta fold hydrolase [Naasia sp. SYSU D00948]|uniref:alpha/beta fold hydrolase n=1 Tax=Naasia sp. SYSU D00948 TaxID=2817379 RepID=UPI001B311EEE|nr:alpha/beta hydrolase [Naasia sp. SYSU D00948]
MTVRGSGPAVVLVHGIPGSARTWDRVAEQLEDRFTVFTPDLLGVGGSDRPRDLRSLLAPAQAAALASALGSQGVEDATVVGHDFGGPVALTLAGAAPGTVARIALLATNAFPNTPIPMPIRAVTWPVAGTALSRLLFSRPSLRMLLGQGTGIGAARLTAASYLGDRGQVRSIRLVFAACLQRMEEVFTPVERALRDWEGPAAVIWGERDPFFPVEQGERTAVLAGTRLIVLPGAGHFLPEERPREVAEAIARLVASSPGVRSGRAS